MSEYSKFNRDDGQRQLYARMVESKSHGMACDAFRISRCSKNVEIWVFNLFNPTQDHRQKFKRQLKFCVKLKEKHRVTVI